MPHFQSSFITNGIEYVRAVAERELELNTIPKLRRWWGGPSCGLADSAPLPDGRCAPQEPAESLQSGLRGQGMTVMFCWSLVQAVEPG